METKINATEVEFFGFIGKYVLAFQSIETIIDQIILLGKGLENWDSGQKYLATNNFIKRKTKRAYTMLTNETPFNARNDIDWLDHIEDCHSRMLEECDTRAKLLHSHFIWDFVEHGGPVIRSYRQKTDDGATFDQQELTASVQDSMLKSISQLAFDYNLIHTQCRQLIK